MGLKRRYKVVFTRETITDEGYLVNEKPPIMGQILETERMFKAVLVPEDVMEEMILEKLFKGLKEELKNPNACLKYKKNNTEIKTEEPEIQTIIPLHPFKN